MPTFRGAARTVRRSLLRRPTALILCYHRIAEPSFDPWRVCVSPQRFAGHLEHLGRRGEVVPLRELPTRLRSSRSRRRPLFALTFDDGYADNLEHGRPLLERYGFPATIFLATDYVVSRRELWWDELERSVFGPPSLPKALQLDGEGAGSSWTLAGEGIDERARLYESLYWHLRALPSDRREGTLDRIADWSGASAEPRPSHRVVSVDEVRTANGGALDFGAHTRSHVELAALPEAAQRAEIVGSKTDLEDLIGEPVETFAYPYGRRQDYTAVTVEIVREAGFRLACVTSSGIVDAETTLLELPRLCIENVAPTEFEQVLNQWLR
jgi:peptidoglycan/xylan/chitin deacetylase (PgdA/CDA1 family)